MRRVSRRWLLTSLGVASTAGCLGDRTDGSERTTEPTTTQSPPESTDTTTEQGRTHPNASPDADHAIRLDNDGSRTQRITVRVERPEAGTTVFETTTAVAPDERKTVYNLQQAAPVGIEMFRIHARVISPTTTAEPPTGTDTVDATGTNSTVDGTATTTDTTTCTGRDTTPADSCRATAYIETSDCYGDATVAWGGSSLGIFFTGIC